MKNKIFWFSLLLVLVCVVGVEVSFAKEKASVGAQRNLTNIHLIYVGMPQEEALAVMGDKIKMGYEIKDKKKGFFEPVYLRHPYRKEKVKHEGKTYQVYYFLTQILKADDIIADDELTPVIFEGGVVVAKGWDALLEMKKK